MLKELNIFGILFAPMALYLVIGLFLFLIVRRIITHFRLERFIWHTSLFDVALFTSLVSLVTIIAISIGW